MKPTLSAVLLLWLALFHAALSLKFDLYAHAGSGGKYQRCVRNFVSRETLVVVTATISGSKGDGQVVNMLVSTSSDSQWLVFILSGRSKIPKIMSTESQKTLSERPGWPSRHILTQLLMSALRTS